MLGQTRDSGVTGERTELVEVGLGLAGSCRVSQGDRAEQGVARPNQKVGRGPEEGQVLVWVEQDRTEQGCLERYGMG